MSTSGHEPHRDPARTLAEHVRRLSDDEVRALLRDRPDLATPTPQDSAQVASRAATRSSVLRALDGLTRLELSLLDALVVAGQTSKSQLFSLVRADEANLEAALSRLEAMLLVWPSPTGLRPLTGVVDVLRAAEAAGLGSGVRPFADPPLAPDFVSERLTRLSDAATALATHVADHGGVGTSGQLTGGSKKTAPSPLHELVDAGVLQPKDRTTVVMPGEFMVALRGGCTTRQPVDVVPELAVTQRDQALVDSSAAGAAWETVRRLELLGDVWSYQPPGVLRNGGLGVRDLKALAAELQVQTAEAGLLVEVAHAAGLIAEGPDEDGELAWLPTDEFDRWVASDAAARWVWLAEAWLGTARLPGLVGQRDGQGRTHNALAAEASSYFAAETRVAALRVLGEAGSGACLATGTGVPSLVSRLEWLRPRRPRIREQLVVWTVTEAGALGLLGLGGLSTAARLLLEDDAAAATSALAALLPAPLDHILVQADLTAIAPGPLTSELARTLHLLADVESRGAATVYRFAPGSIRRAFDAGWSAAEVTAFLDQASRTELPQALRYLIDDVARTFGTVRVGHAEAFLRADDEAALTDLLHHPKAGSLGLRRLAPTVLISTVPADVLIPRLRELGAAPVLEAADGTVQVARRDQQRARRPRHETNASSRPWVQAAHDEARLAAAVRGLRAGDAAAEASGSVRSAAATPAGALTALREAIESGTRVLIEYVDNHGSASQRLLDPLRVEGGQLSARDWRSGEVRTFAIHRVSWVRPAETQAPGS